MRRRARTAMLLLVATPALLPGCIAAIGNGRGRPLEETPTQRELTSLEKRMDRIDERLPKQ